MSGTKRSADAAASDDPNKHHCTGSVFDWLAEEIFEQIRNCLAIGELNVTRLVSWRWSSLIHLKGVVMHKDCCRTLGRFLVRHWLGLGRTDAVQQMFLVENRSSLVHDIPSVVEAAAGNLLSFSWLASNGVVDQEHLGTIAAFVKAINSGLVDVAVAIIPRLGAYDKERFLMTGDPRAFGVFDPPNMATCEWLTSRFAAYTPFFWRHAAASANEIFVKCLEKVRGQGTVDKWALYATDRDFLARHSTIEDFRGFHSMADQYIEVTEEAVLYWLERTVDAPDGRKCHRVWMNESLNRTWVRVFTFCMGHATDTERLGGYISYRLDRIDVSILRAIVERLGDVLIVDGRHVAELQAGGYVDREKKNLRISFALEHASQRIDPQYAVFLFQNCCAGMLQHCRRFRDVETCNAIMQSGFEGTMNHEWVRFLCVDMKLSLATQSSKEWLEDTILLEQARLRSLSQ